MQIDTPIVFVLGTGEHTDKFEIQLSLREELLKRGYKVSQIGSRSCCKLFGFHSIPEFMTSTGISEGDKIICFNNFVKQIELNEKPELIVIGIPGGAMEIDNMFNNNYGILAFEISRAVEPDYVILSSYFEKYNMKYFENIGKGIKGRMGFPVGCHVLSHIKVDWNESINRRSLTYLSLDTDFVTEYLNGLSDKDTPVINIFEKNGPSSLTDNVIESLSANNYANPV